MNTTEDFNAKKRVLLNQFKDAKTIGKEDAILAEIKELEAAESRQKKVSQLDRVNKVQAERREILRELMSLEMPTEDIRVQDGCFHAAKIKKYPELMELANSKYLRFEFEDGVYHSAKGRDRFTILKPVYEGNKRTYAPFDNFNHACDFNGIMREHLTFEKFTAMELEIITESDRIKKEIEKSREALTKMGAWELLSNNLLRQTQPHVTEYFEI